MESKSSTSKSNKSKINIETENKMEENQNKNLKLYINEKWFISIDENGYCTSTYYEGALGIVIKIKNNDITITVDTFKKK